MTCVVAVASSDEVVIATDSLYVGEDGTKLIVDEPKLIYLGEHSALGFAGSRRDYLKARDAVAQAVDSWRARDVRACLTGALSGKSKDVSLSLVGFINGELLLFDEEFSHYSPACGYAAVGTGAMPALGSLYTSAGRSAKERAVLALDAASAIVNSVSPPYHFWAKQR